MLLIDLSHTSHTPARTGIQRVARSILQHLGNQAVPVTRDPFLDAWRRLEPWELANLAQTQGGRKRGARWPFAAKLRGRLRRTFGRTSAHALRGDFDALIEPELFTPAVARNFPQLFSHVRGPCVALFLDALPLRFPEFTPPATVARFPAYLRELLQFDGIAAISADSRDSLLSYWRWLGISNPPPVLALPLGVDPIPTKRNLIDYPSSGASPVVLSVGTLEGRKNHLALLDAAESLWSRGAAFELRLIGHANATGAAALARLRSLQAAGRPLRYDGPASDETIARAYADCTFTVYPSIAEGFGLPVIESLALGKPCICSARGALGEISLHGGCLALDSVDAPSLATAIDSLLQHPSRLAELADAARRRTFKSWADYTRELETWIHTLPRRRA
jgi:Glycosyltransferase